MTLGLREGGEWWWGWGGGTFSQMTFLYWINLLQIAGISVEVASIIISWSVVMMIHRLEVIKLVTAEPQHDAVNKMINMIQSIN